MATFIRVLAAAVAVLFVAQVYVMLTAPPAAPPAAAPSPAASVPAAAPPSSGAQAPPRPGPSNLPPGAPPQPLPVGDLEVGAPMELNWILCRMASTPDVAPRGEQKENMLAVLEKAKAYTEEMNPLWVESQALVRESLTSPQRAYIVEKLDQMRKQNQRIGGGPMNQDLLGLITRKLGRDFMGEDVHALLAQAKAVPPASESGVIDALNPEDFAWGVTVLEDAPGLGITKDQAVRIAPYVKLQTDLFQSHEHEKVALIGLLTPAQKEFVRATRQKGYPPDNPPFATVVELIAALQAR